MGETGASWYDVGNNSLEREIWTTSERRESLERYPSGGERGLRQALTLGKVEFVSVGAYRYESVVVRTQAHSLLIASILSVK